MKNFLMKWTKKIHWFLFRKAWNKKKIEESKETAYRGGEGVELYDLSSRHKRTARFTVAPIVQSKSLSGRPLARLRRKRKEPGELGFMTNKLRPIYFAPKNYRENRMRMTPVLKINGKEVKV